MDQLNAYLVEHYPTYITGRTDCNLLLWGAEERANQTPKVCTLIVGVEYDPKSATEEQVTALINEKHEKDSHFRLMCRFGDEIASKGSVPYIVIGFPCFRTQYDGRWEDTEAAYPLRDVSFLLYDQPSGKGKLISGLELRSHLYGFLGGTYADTGTSKRKNKSIADYFQFWSRSFLTRHLVKLDIDGMLFNQSNGVMIEIKRSAIPEIPRWRPYRADFPDFGLQKSFADSLHMEFTILHHDGRHSCGPDTVISLFEVEQVNEDFREITCSRLVPEMKLEGPDSLQTYLQRYL